MTSWSQALVTRRLRAPTGDHTALVEPPFSSIADVLQANQALLAQHDRDLQGRSLANLAADARHQLLDAARSYTGTYRALPAKSPVDRIIMAGHQPVLFHPGVWFKNFALDHLATQHDAVAINLVIDSDTLKSASIRVPGGSSSTPVTADIPYDQPAGEIPHEERPLLDANLFATFADRVARQIAPLVPDPSVQQFWPLAVERARATQNLGAAIAQARHQFEGQLGLATLELPQGHVCELPAFHWFTAHLLAHLPRFWSVYNQAIRQYRHANRLRSTSHPVPELVCADDWLEAPYWLWQADSPRRHRAFVRQQGDTLTISDRREIRFELPLSPEADATRAVDVLAQLASRGIKLRSRALTTTLFARLILCDLFLHGIGGAKYDELTNQLMLNFFDVEPPEIMVLSATLLLPTPRQPATVSDRRRLVQHLRQLTFHPERFLPPANASSQSTTAQLIAEKRRWINAEPTRATAQKRCRAIRAANRALQPAVAAERERTLRSLADTDETLRANHMLAWREYAFCLHPLSSLRDFMLAFLPSEP